ncbi:hypothetical protein [Streptomyces sp. NPDC054887]
MTTAPSPLEAHLRAELREAREQLAALNERCLDLQAANEAAYQASYNLTGGPSFDKAKPFGQLAENTFADPVKQAAARLLQRTEWETTA